MSSDISQLISQAQSPDNSLREHAEQQLLQSCDSNASLIFQALTDVAINNSNKLAARQFALLSLRKLITFYWSPGFESYRNTSQIDLDTKSSLRNYLIQLALDDNQDSKIKSSASYCVTQISAVDFPDQWPELLSILYGCITQHYSLSAIKLLNEIYDDIVSEEMFFEGNIGLETLSIVYQLLESGDNVSIQARIALVDLLNATITQMTNVDSNLTEKRKQLLSESIPRALGLLSNILEMSHRDISTDSLTFIGKIYEILVLIKNELPKKFFSAQTRDAYKRITLNTLSLLQNKYASMTEPAETELESFSECAIHTLEFLTSLSYNTNFTEEERTIILNSLLVLCSLDPVTKETWLADFNHFVSKETGLLPSYTIRDQSFEFLTSLIDQNFQLILKSIFQYFFTLISSSSPSVDPSQLETTFYLLQSILSNDDDIENVNNEEITSVLRVLPSLLTNVHDSLMVSRIILALPKILEKFMDDLPDVKAMVQTFLVQSTELALRLSGDYIIKSSVLISFTSYCYFAELPSVLGPELCASIQKSILTLMKQVSNESEDDTNGLLTEVLNNIIECNSTNTSQEILQTEFSLLFSISSKDPSNVQIVVESQESLEKLLTNVTEKVYLEYIQIYLPPFINIIHANSTTSYRYSPLLSLVLEFITIFMKKKPSDSKILPESIIANLFQPLVDILTTSTEDETLQLTTDAFTYIIYNTDSEKVMPYLETVVNILDRLLSLDVTDTAAMNVGTLIVTIFTKFSAQISSLIPTILNAAVNRLIDCKNISTQQNLVSLLCFLFYSNTQETVDFLFNLPQQNIVRDVLIKWFESFEIIRGEKKIKENIIALGKLYCLHDEKLFSIKVNGDIIPYEGDLIITRSRAKSLPDKYTQITIFEKIIKLFIAELGFQNKQPAIENLMTNETTALGDSNENDDEWEDVDDVLDYDKLKEYVNDEDELDGEDSREYGEGDEEEITGLGDVSQTVTELIIGFFKDVTSKNVNNFQSIYDTLSENEKMILTQYLV
ncbi:hypothetical protein KAFR_0J00190 [Kazachstania africana CBS 2517]|uniref:Importin N-terminal domain-containing protein n=1 Tax=Kazachstania africana (strain ATCC 22294 / BCRC 22015 / CBS 2517 / CECT 1963 / NBRC 1671 / NRRL Y-8276) TaxID=1071382 RepID=H2B0D7_KAZAF|nr:hypothetical protein KAFR_0J00190 [Kazachstania africana CBS 2517]CCF60087.1 hypothetical protein KAFR_0J00190 [Kazachstania africana CBS 2517]